MRKIIFAFIFILSLGFSDGIVETNSFYSESLDQTRNFTIYLPEEYYNSDDDYPVVYFLHGFGGNNNTYNAMHSSLNSMMGTEIIDMIVVSADGSTNIYDGSFYTNSILNGDYEDYIAYDLVNHIDQNYRTKAAKEYRALSGHSMGGYGAFRLGLYHSDTFNSFASHSAPIHLESLNNPFLINAILIEAFFGPLEPDNGPFTLMMFGLSSAFSPNMDNPPWYVDLPMDSGGNVDWDVFALWQNHDPYLLVNNHVESLLNQNIYFDCGSQDELQVAPHSEDIHDVLTDLNVPHTYQSYSGTHSSHIYERLEISYQFHSDYFESVSPVVLGDINNDGVINVLDVVLSINFILSVDNPSNEEMAAADLNEDGILNVLDIVLLVNLILGTI